MNFEHPYARARESTLSRSFNELSIATIEKVRGTIIEK